MAHGQLFENPPERNAPRGEQHHGVEPEIGNLGHDARVALASQRRRHDFGCFLADLPADLALPDGKMVFWGGSALRDGVVDSKGGRVLTVTALGGGAGTI